MLTVQLGLHVELVCRWRQVLHHTDRILAGCAAAGQLCGHRLARLHILSMHSCQPPVASSHAFRGTRVFGQVLTRLGSKPCMGRLHCRGHWMQSGPALFRGRALDMHLRMGEHLSHPEHQAAGRCHAQALLCMLRHLCAHFTELHSMDSGSAHMKGVQLKISVTATLCYTWPTWQVTHPAKDALGRVGQLLEASLQIHVHAV